MKKSKNHFEEMRVRGLALDKKVRLQKIAKSEGKSLNQFLLEKLELLSGQQEVINLEAKYQETIMKMTEVIKTNQQVIDQNNQILSIFIGDEQTNVE